MNGNGYGNGAPPPGYGYPQSPGGYGPPQGAPPQGQGYGQPPPGYGAPQGAPPQGYGGFPGAPMGQGYPPPMGQGGYPQQGGFNPWAKVGHGVGPSSNLPHLSLGDGRLCVELVKLVNSPKGLYYIVEVLIMGWSNPMNAPGSRACFMPNVSGQYADSGAADAMSFVAACIGMQSSDPRAKLLGCNTPEEAQQVMVRSTNEQEQPLRGCIVDCSVFAKPKKTKPGETFNKHTWRPVLDGQGLPMKQNPQALAASLPQAAPSGQGPSVGAPAPQGHGAPPGYGYQGPPQSAPGYGPPGSPSHGAPGGFGGPPAPTGAPSPAPVGFGYGAPQGAPPGQPAPQAAPPKPPGEWFDFPEGDPRRGRQWYNRQNQVWPPA